MATRPRTRTTRTRSELDTELDEVRSRTASREVLDPKALEAQRRQEQETRQAAANLTVQKAAQKVTQVGIDVQGAVAKVSEQLMETTQELATLHSAVLLERQELEELHGKDVIASSIDALLAQHAEQEKSLDQQIAAKRQQWTEEQIAHNKALQAQNEENARARQRDNDEYQYNTAQARRDAQDKFDESLRAKDKAARERQETLEKGWIAREEKIKTQEKEFTDAVAKATALEVENKKLDGQISSLGAQLRDLKHATALDKAADAQKLALAEQANKALDTANHALADQVLKLTQQLDAAREQVKEIATKSVEGASGRLALSEIKETLASQGGPNGPGNRKS
jgi:predicted amino acid-binding ACT domain protein